LSSEHLPPLVRSKMIEYDAEKTAGLYGASLHCRPDLPQVEGSTARNRAGEQLPLNAFASWQQKATRGSHGRHGILDDPD
jgi:hypothetical protein